MAPATATVAESGEHRPSRLLAGPAMVRPPAAAEQQEQLRCPRCESTNTKFCYYNNYNLAQPRHFCKSCRRYWTKGGALRNIPVGGGSRKSSAKRHRAVLPAAAPAAADTEATPLPAIAADFGYAPLLPSSAAAYGGFLALGAEPLLSRAGLGLGFAPSSLEEMIGFGASLTAKSMFPEVAPSPEMFSSTGGPWQLAAGGGCVGDAGDCFPWPELAISAPGGKGLRP